MTCKTIVASVYVNDNATPKEIDSYSGFIPSIDSRITLSKVAISYAAASHSDAHVHVSAMPPP